MNSKENKFFLFVFVATLAAAAWLRFPYIFSESMWSDEGLYCWFGKQVFSNPLLLFSREVSRDHPPLFVALLALGHFFLSPEIACRFVIFVIYLLGIWAIYRLGVKVRSPFVGLLSAILLAFNLSYFFLSTRILNDVPFAVFVLFFMTALLGTKESQLDVYDWKATFLGSLAIMTKTGGYLLIPIVVIYYAIALKSTPLSLRLKKIALVAGAMAMVQGGLIFNNYLHLGEGHLGHSVVNFFPTGDITHKIQDIFSVCCHPLIVILGHYCPNVH